ncbi:MAG: TonB family protein [Bacteroidales bacterium]|nr:TonB family protein [Bacteroidales bacterium]
MRRFALVLAAALICGAVMAQPRKMTIHEFRVMSAKDTTTCELTGVVSMIRNYQHGNLYLKDDTGEVLIYGIINRQGLRDFMPLDVTVGDSLTVVGRRTVYDNRTIEMKDARFVSRVCGPKHGVIIDEDCIPDTFPLFKGEDPHGAFSEWVNSKLRYPEDAMRNGTEGTVLVSFTINEDGRVASMQILESPCPSLGMEALRVLAKSPKWTPGTVNGKPVKVRYTFPIGFHINN